MTTFEFGIWKKSGSLVLATCLATFLATSLMGLSACSSQQGGETNRLVVPPGETQPRPSQPGSDKDGDESDRYPSDDESGGPSRDPSRGRGDDQTGRQDDRKQDQVRTDPIQNENGDLVEMKLTTSIWFEFDQALLRTSGKVAINDLIDRMRLSDTIRSVKISGHADRIGTDDYNARLSLRRAESVREYMMERAAQIFRTGLRADLVTVSAFGEAKPVTRCPEDLSREDAIDCLARDRRADVSVSVLASPSLGGERIPVRRR